MKCVQHVLRFMRNINSPRILNQHNEYSSNNITLNGRDHQSFILKRHWFYTLIQIYAFFYAFGMYKLNRDRSPFLSAETNSRQELVKE